jgi:1,2-diacylglycerol 3-alpha-glucosyltransferase
MTSRAATDGGLRILLTTESFLPYVSGVTVAVDALARGLGARGHEVLVLAPRPDQHSGVTSVGSSGPAPDVAWLPSYQLPAVAPKGYRMPWPLPGAEAVRRAHAFRPQLVHAHSPFVTGMLARRIANRAGAPLVFTHHTRFGDYTHYLAALDGVARAVTDRYLRRFWSRCDAILAPSSDLAGEIRGRLPPAVRERVHVAPTGIDVAAIRRLERLDARVAAGWPPDSVVVGALGRLAPEKRPELLLEAIAAGLADAPGLRLLVIGGGPSEPELRARADGADLHGRVAFTGALERPAALRMLTGCDLFLFVSRTETQGLVLAEALAAGLPAVAVDGPAVRDSVRDGVDGVIVADGAPGEVAGRLGRALARLADAGVRVPLAARAAGDADRFALERSVAEVERIYRTLVAR